MVTHNVRTLFAHEDSPPCTTIDFCSTGVFLLYGPCWIPNSPPWEQYIAAAKFLTGYMASRHTTNSLEALNAYICRIHTININVINSEHFAMLNTASAQRTLIHCNTEIRTIKLIVSSHLLTSSFLQSNASNNASFNSFSWSNNASFNSFSWHIRRHLCLMLSNQNHPRV